MSDPLRRLKLLPWRSLFLVAALTIVTAIVLDFLVALGYTYSPIIRTILSSPFASWIAAAAGIGIGALAVIILERYRQVIISASVLWALILCLALGLVVKSLLPFPAVLIGLDEIQLITIVVGVFWKGRPYWR